MCDPDDVWGIYSAGVDADDDFRLVRSLDDPRVWRGEIYIYGEQYNDYDNVDEKCLSFTVWISGADNKIIDLVSRSIHEYADRQ